MKPSGSLLTSRGLIVFGLLLFSLSTSFPIVASVRDMEQVPLWVGGVDVALALLLAGLMVLIEWQARGHIDYEVQQDSYRIYRALSHLLLVVLIVFFFFGNEVKWGVLLPGLAWRAWLLLYTLPSALALWKTTGATASAHN